MPPTISLIVRTVGRPELDRALASIGAQSYSPIETVLVLARPEIDPSQYEGRPGIRVVCNAQPLDRPAAANAGLQIASGDWIGFLDEDDWLDPEHVKGLVEAVEPLSAFKVVYSDMTAHEGSGREVRHNPGFWKRRHTLSPIAWINAALFSRELVEQHHCAFDAEFELLEDWDFFVQCAEYSDFLHVSASTAHYDAQAGASGGGSGINRDNERLRPFVEKMTRKWGGRYAELVAVADAALEQVDVALRRQDWAGAQAAAEHGLAIDPGHPGLLNRLAVLYQRENRWKQVLRILRRACDSDPKAFVMLGELAMLEHEFGFEDRARAAFERMASLAGTDEQRGRVLLVGQQLRDGPSH